MPDTATGPLLQARGAAFAFGPCCVLDGVDADFHAGRVTALLGPNGAGKSTLLRLLSGERHPVTGSVTFAGRPLAQWHSRELARRRAVLPQSPRLTFPLSVEEVVLLGRAPHLHGAEGADDREIAHAALEAVDMARAGGRAYTALSGGERQRVQLARVLAQVWQRAGTALLLDEPVSALDLAHQHATLALARQWAAAGACVVAILHDLNLALRHADDALVLHRGRVAAAGPVRVVITEALVRDVFEVPASLMQAADGTPFVVTG